MSDSIEIPKEKKDNLSKTNVPDWEKNFLENLPCAVCILKNDANLSILAGNQSFYQLFGCTVEDMKHKYDNRLGALIDTNSLKELDNLINRKNLNQKQMTGTKLQIKRNGNDAWIYMEIFSQNTLLYCTSFDITDSEQKQNFFLDYKDKIQFISKQANFDVFTYDLQKKTVHIHSSRIVISQIFDVVKKEYSDFSEELISSGVIQKSDDEIIKKALKKLEKEEKKFVYELRMKTRNNQIMWVRITIAVKQNRIGSGEYAIGILEDITQQKEAARSYLNETQFYQAMLSEKDAYAQVDITEDHITRIGGMWNLYNEVKDKMPYSKLTKEFINKVVHPEDRKHYIELMERSNFIESLENGIDKLGCEFRRIVEQNKMMWMELSIHLFKDSFTHHILALIYIKNIDAKKKQELLLLHDSKFDQLTNIYNKKMAERIIEAQLKQSSPQERHAFIILDLDNFKEINDSYGHKAGDQVLVKIAHILNYVFCKRDIIGRFGGDEFIIFLKGIQSKESVEEYIKELYRILQKTSGLEGISCSIGIVLFQGGASYEHIFQQADVALYTAKNRKKGQYVFYQNQESNYQWESDISGRKEEVQDFAAILPEKDENFSEKSQDCSFDSFIAEQGDIAYLVDPNTFDLICGNKAFYDRIGKTEIECVGLKCYEVMHKRESPCPFCSKANWTSDKFYLWKNMNIALEQEFLIKNKLVQWQGQEVLLALAIDISNNKSIVDSLENGMMESHSILSGIQSMAMSETLAKAMESALETIGYFFRASSASFWKYEEEKGAYDCAYTWTKSEQNEALMNKGKYEVNIWLQGKKWEQPVILENPEAMLCYSYDMYQFMKQNNIRNQRWIQVKDEEHELGCIAVSNISSNFQNIAFLESFSVFITNEIKKRSMMEGMVYASNHDDLTNLLSRRSFEDYLLNYRPDQVSCIGVMVANFNNLKEINSSMGFRTGNYYIKQFADMLKEIFHVKHIYRLNGDEFLVIVTNIERVLLEEKICKLEKLMQENGNYTVSIGYSWDNVENDLALLIEQSTQAMKVNKKRHYDSSSISIDTQRRKMLSGLVASIENGEFEVFLQPKVELEHNNIIGAEALIRYRHEKLGLIAPGQFIDILEKNNLIRYVDLYVFEEVCKLLENWRKNGSFTPAVSLNFSRLTLLERNILATMETIISQYDVPKKLIEIEITESVSNMGKSILYQAACDIYHAGFAISLDDFGTKYTNLSILADIDFSMLKLDKSLIGSLGEQLNHQIILKNVISMCKELGISVIAEGIETKEQEEILRKMECKLGQGYLYGKPMPIKEFNQKFIYHLQS